MENTIEQRIVDAELEVRDAADGDPKPKIVGYAAVFNSRSMQLGGPNGFVEQIEPGAFANDLNNPALDVRALINHDRNKILGRTTAGTLKLSTDRKGLRFEVTPPDTQYARDLAESIKRGDISQCSFSFRVMPKGDTWTEEPGGGMLRTLKNVSIHQLGDVSPVTFAAYPDTEVQMRSLIEEGRERLYFEPSDARDAEKPYGDVAYADPGYQSDGKKRYPIDTAEHIKAAWNYINKSGNAGKYSADQVSKIKAKIIAAWKAKIDKDGPPSAESKSAEDDAERAALERDRELELAEQE